MQSTTQIRRKKVILTRKPCGEQRRDNGTHAQSQLVSSSGSSAGQSILGTVGREVLTRSSNGPQVWPDKQGLFINALLWVFTWPRRGLLTGTGENACKSTQQSSHKAGAPDVLVHSQSLISTVCLD